MEAQISYHFLTTNLIEAQKTSLNSFITDYTLTSKKINQKFTQSFENKGFAGIPLKSTFFLRDQEVGSSNLLSPTILSFAYFF
jgi:hypothetical protein